LFLALAALADAMRERYAGFSQMHESRLLSAPPRFSQLNNLKAKVLTLLANQMRPSDYVQTW
jgi:hypothetical protein